MMILVIMMADRKRIAVVRVRGCVKVPGSLHATFRNLRLTRVNHCVLLENTPTNMGAVALVKDYITWGEVDAEAVKALIQSKGRLSGNKVISEAHLKASGFDGFDAFAKKFAGFEAELGSVKEMKRVFRLHPPRKGYGTIKKRYPYGALGNRGAEMEKLLKRMM